MAKSSNPNQTPADRSTKAHVPSPPPRHDLGPAEQPGREEDLGRAADGGRQTPADRSAKTHVPSPPRRLDLGPAEQPGREADVGRPTDRGRRPPHRK